MRIVKSISRFFRFNDWIWSIVLGFMAYWLMNWGPPSIGNVAMTYYAVNWLQPLIATGAIMAGLCFITRLALFFYFKKIHNYIWGHRYKVNGNEKGRIFKIHSQIDFKYLNDPWHKLLLALFIFGGLFCAALVVFLKMLSLAGNALL